MDTVRVKPVKPKWWDRVPPIHVERPPSPDPAATQKEKRRFYKQTYLEQIRRATPPWADKAKIRSIYQEVAKKNRMARGWMASHKRSKKNKVAFSVDHIIPLRGDKVSGLHVHENLRIIRAADNSRKGNSVVEHHDSDTDRQM